MAKSEPFENPRAPGLDDISTRWPLIRDPVQFVMRYAPAIQAYLQAILKNRHDAEEVSQDFLLKGLLRGLLRTEHLHGRFRHYLKTAVRNAAIDHLQKRKPAPLSDATRLPDPHDPETRADSEWVAQWRTCLLDRTFQALDHHQRQTKGNLFHTALRLTVDHPDEDSKALAARASASVGRAIGAAAFRQQLSRARRLFADLLVEEVRHTLQTPTRELIEEELAELGLLSFVRDIVVD